MQNISINTSVNSPFTGFNEKICHARKEAGLETRKECTKPSTQLKMASLAGTVVTTLAALYLIAKHPSQAGKFDKNASTLSNMFSIQYDKPRTLLALGVGTITGGLAGGLLFDKKENQGAKLKEGLHQFIGNIAVPLLIIECGFGIIDKYKLRFPAMKGSGKGVQIANIVIDKLPRILTSLFGIAVGIPLGNTVSNACNSLLFQQPDHRKLKVMDYGIHADEVFEIAAFVDGSGKWKSVLGKILPITYGICGYLTGISQEKSEVTSRHCKNVTTVI